MKIQNYIDFLSGKGLKETYINGLIKNFRAFFRYCEEEKYINRNPMFKVKWQREVIPVIETFTNDEVKRMIAYYNSSRFLDIINKLIMIILFDTGLRNSELCNLKLEDIRDTFICVHGKGKKVRHVPITAIINKYLIKYIRVRDNYIKDKFAYQVEHLLVSQKDKKLTVETLERIIKDCGDGCNVRKWIRCSPHTCRHYFAQTQLKNLVNIQPINKYGTKLFSFDRGGTMKKQMLIIICFIVMVFFGIILPYIQHRVIENNKIETVEVEKTDNARFDKLNQTMQNVTVSEENLLLNIFNDSLFNLLELILTLGSGAATVVLVILKLINEKTGQSNLLISVLVFVFVAASLYGSISSYANYSKPLLSDAKTLFNEITSYGDYFIEETEDMFKLPK